MPRGRAGLPMIPPEEVAAACKRRSHDLVADHFGVTWRTLRRWLATGLPLNYGRVNISREQWDAFVAIPPDEWRRLAEAKVKRGHLQRRPRWARPELRSW